MSAQPSPYHSHAERYLAAGWTGVLPLPHQRKSPPPKGYTGAEGREPTPLDVERWRRDPSTGNVALHMPHDIVGIDVDCYGDKPGAKTWADLCDQLGTPPPNWSSTSRTDGSAIRFYRLPRPVRLIGALPGVEIIQHHHRYAVVAPSIHPDTAAPYRWISPDGEVGDLIPPADELPTLPEAWVAHLSAELRSSSERRSLATASDVSPAVDRAYGEAVRGLTEGTRHDTALAGVSALIRLDGLGHPGASDAIERLRGDFLRAIAGSRSDREAEAEWERMIDGATRLVSTTPSIAPPYQASRQPPRNTKAAALDASVEADEPWDEPIGLDAGTPPPEVPIDTLPDWMAAQVRNITEQLGCDPVLPFMFCLGALSVATLSHVRIWVREGQMLDSTGLYLLAAAPPASGKSPALKMAFSPIRAHEAQAIEFARTALAESDAEREQLRKSYERARDLAAATGDPDDSAKAKELAVTLSGVETPPAGELMTSDVTPERLASLMAANRERIAIVSDESGVLAVDRYAERGAPAKLDLYLGAFTGEPVVVHRVKAPTVRLQRPLLAVVAGVQPEALAAALSDPQWRTRGMGARFLVARTTKIATNTDIDRDVWDRDVAAAYNDRLGALVASCASWATPATLHLSRPARARYSLWSGELRLRQLEGGDLEGESGWASKMSSSVLRIAGLLHLADGHPHGEEIGVDQMDRAIAIGEFSTGHHTAATGVGETASVVKLGRWLAIRTETVCRATPRATNRFVARRDLAREGPRKLRSRDETSGPLTDLAEAGLVRFPLDANVLLSTAARTAKTIEVHPEIERFLGCATVRDNARQTPLVDHEGSRDAEGVALVALVAEGGFPEPPFLGLSSTTPTPLPPPRATSATSATEPESQYISQGDGEDLSTRLLALTTDDPYAAVGDLATASSTADGEGPPFGVLAVTNTEHPNHQNPDDADPTTLEAP